MSSVSLYLDTRRSKKDKTYPIKLYVSHHKRFYISTPFTSLEEEWEVNQYAKSAPNSKPRNMSLRRMLNKAEDVLFQLEKEERLSATTDEALKRLLSDAISDKVRSERTVLTCFDEFVATKTNEGTITNYLGTKKKIMEFDDDPPLGKIDKKWLMSFDAWMANSNLKVNTRSIQLRNLRAVFNYAIDEEYTTNYPFRKFSIKNEETRKRSLTPEQLALLRDYPVEPFQERFRDFFMLMFYLIGINAVDLFNCKSLVGDRIEYRRAKTGKLYSIKVEPEAMEIINKYRGTDLLLDNGYQNYKHFLHRMDVNLQKIGPYERVGLGGKKIYDPLFPDLSSYWSRHSWATIAASLDIPKETISEALGHEIGSAVTSIYIKFDQRKVDEANRKVIDFLNTIKAEE